MWVYKMSISSAYIKTIVHVQGHPASRQSSARKAATAKRAAAESDLRAADSKSTDQRRGRRVDAAGRR